MAPRKAKPKTDNVLLASLKNLSSITKDEGKPYETHVLLSDNWATAFNGVIAAGEKIESDLQACPHNSSLIQALAKCGQKFSITQLDNNRLSIKSNKFKALVRCLPVNDMPVSIPDAPIAPIDDRLKAALSAVGVLAEEGADSIVAASVLIHGGSAIATDRFVFMEYWHGIDLPPNLALPKAVIKPLTTNSKKLTAFGFSKSSASFYFEDMSWIRSQFFAEPWPNIGPILDRKCNACPVPVDFYDALAAVAPFSESGYVYFDAGILRSHADQGIGASYEIYGLPKGPIFSIKQLKMIQPHVKTIDFMAPGPHNSKMLMFYGDDVRGCIAGRETR